LTSIQSKNQVNRSERRSEKPSLGRDVLGIAGGTAAGFATFKAGNIPMKAYYKSFLQNIDKFTPEEKDQLIDEANKMVVKSEIKEKGFKGISLIDTAEKKSDEIMDGLNKHFNINIDDIPKTDEINAKRTNPKNRIKISANEALSEIGRGVGEKSRTGTLGEKLKMKFLRITRTLPVFSQRILGNFQTGKAQDSIRMGLFDSISNKIYAGQPGSLLHEVGHAINRNGSLLSKAPLNIYLISKQLLIPAAIFTSVFSTRPKETDNKHEHKGFMIKVRDFVHKNIGLTIVGLSLPLLYEEASATIKAINFVNKSDVLSKNAQKQHNKALKLAYGTYVISTAIFATTAQIVIAVKDKIQTPKHSKKD